MKHLLFISAMLAFSFAAQSQQMVFNINQSGAAYKNRVGKYDDVELKDANVVIRLQNQAVQIIDDKASNYKLTNIEQEQKVNVHTYSQIGHGTDGDNNPVTFKFTVNTKSKEAVVEVAGKGAKNYYFGTCTYGEKLTRL